MSIRTQRLGCCGGAAALGFLFAGTYALVTFRFSPLPTGLAEYAPMPHHVPPRAGGVAFRFAMIHDILHERYPRHGPAYHRERVRITRGQIAKLDAGSPRALALTATLAESLIARGEHAEAAVILRTLLARQQALGHEGARLCGTLAALGACLTRGAFTEAASADGPARARFREGVNLLLLAAGRGREKWQAVTAELHLAAMHQPSLLAEYDCVGSRLSERYHGQAAYPTYGRDVFADGPAEEMQAAARAGARLDDPARWEDFKKVRQYVARVWGDKGWAAIPVHSHREPVQFDEPMLALVRQWRECGPDPHLALAIAGTMLRVGQRRIAFAAYLRAERLADAFWPDEETREAFLAHCRGRAELIPTFFGKNEDAPSAAAFEDELAHGEAYQRAYQTYEVDKIAAGASIDDPAFYDAFHAGREPIESPSGAEEWFAFVPGAKKDQYTGWRTFSWAVAGAGTAAFVAALIIRLLTLHSGR